MDARWQFWIDRGGTFTDLVARRPDGRLVTHKLLSENPTRYADAAVAGIRAVLGVPEPAPVPVARIEAVRMGTTVATNALLERAGEPTVLVITKGFADALRIGYQNRPRIFDRRIVLPEMLYRRVIEVDERITAGGEVLRPPALGPLEAELRRAYGDGIRSVAVVCLHSHLYPAHEREIAELATRVGFPQVSRSSEVSPLMRLVPRGDTTVVDAYLSPVLRRYIASVSSQLTTAGANEGTPSGAVDSRTPPAGGAESDPTGGRPAPIARNRPEASGDGGPEASGGGGPEPSCRLMFMQSNGGLAEAGHFRGKDAILSGPAGGIVGMARMSELAGFDKVIGFDMGGTSTDVSHYAGAYERVFNTQVAGVRLRAPMIDIHTVAAGGGSILHFDGSRYRVGPGSAGAYPGPACYRNSGPLTVTDANVMLGRIQPDFFPRVFGPDGDRALDADLVRRDFTELAADISRQTGDERGPEQVAEAYLRIAVANMANAVKRISVQKGHDITDYALTTFGGAGGQHACAVADSLGIRTVLVPPMAGVLSALGIGLADTTAMREQSVEAPLGPATLDRLNEVAGSLADAARAELLREAVPAERIRLRRRVHLRYDGTDTAVPVALADLDAMVAEFEAAYRRMYSFLMDRPLIAEAVSVEAVGLTEQPDLAPSPGAPDPAGAPTGDDRAPGGPAGDIAGAGTAVGGGVGGGGAGAGTAVVGGGVGGDGAGAGTAVGGGVGGDGAGAGGGGTTGGAMPVTEVSMYTGSAWRKVPLYRRELLGAGDRLSGPAIVTEADSTTIVDDGWGAEVTGQGHLVMRRVRTRDDEPDVTTRADPVLLEIFNNLFMSIAEQMGARLESTAQSVNIRERLDFSCALFDPDGNLIANAPHIPVHLGSMGASVKEVIRRRGDELRPGDVCAINDPYHGGTHLPDVTVVTPVFDTGTEPSDAGGIGSAACGRPGQGHGRRVLFYVASRGHHAEIGGKTPGSMPADSRELVEEGVLFDNWMLVRDGRLREEETLRLLRSAAYPSRDPETNLADLRAQIAANAKGVDEVARMIDHFGLDVVLAYMRHVQDNAEEAVRRVIGALDDGEYRYETDSGAVIAVRVSVDRALRAATIDFTGTSAQLATNFNAPSAVVTAAVLYTFRTLVDDDIPLNDGCLRPLRIVVPEGSMLAPRPPAAVVAGNVETSQAITGALYAALGVQAEGSGTMNNISFGNQRHQYYETVASGSGAGDGFDGAPVVQTHMTNSRLTDPEVLEWRLPVLLEEFAIRRGSGGEGRWRGGDGAVRRIVFREAMTVSTLCGHRRVPPYGMAGGAPGALGANRVRRADGRHEELPGCGSIEVGAGDTLIVETPGGGGYGTP